MDCRAKEAESLERARRANDEDLSKLYSTIAMQWRTLAQVVESRHRYAAITGPAKLASVSRGNADLENASTTPANSDDHPISRVQQNDEAESTSGPTSQLERNRSETLEVRVTDTPQIFSQVGSDALPGDPPSIQIAGSEATAQLNVDPESDLIEVLGTEDEICDTLVGSDSQCTGSLSRRVPNCDASENLPALGGGAIDHQTRLQGAADQPLTETGDSGVLCRGEDGWNEMLGYPLLEEIELKSSVFATSSFHEPTGESGLGQILPKSDAASGERPDGRPSAAELKDPELESVARPETQALQIADSDGNDVQLGGCTVLVENRSDRSGSISFGFRSNDNADDPLAPENSSKPLINRDQKSFAGGQEDITTGPPIGGAPEACMGTSEAALKSNSCERQDVPDEARVQTPLNWLLSCWFNPYRR